MVERGRAWEESLEEVDIDRSCDCVKRVRDRNEEMFCFKNRFSPPHHIFILKKDLNAAFIDELAPFSAYLGSHIAKNHKQNTNFQGRKWDCSFKEQIHVLAHKTSKKSIIWDTNWILKRFWPLSCKKFELSRIDKYRHICLVKELLNSFLSTTIIR